MKKQEVDVADEPVSVEVLQPNYITLFNRNPYPVTINYDDANVKQNFMMSPRERVQKVDKNLLFASLPSGVTILGRQK
jgi:hypothetical protein